VQRTAGDRSELWEKTKTKPDWTPDASIRRYSVHETFATLLLPVIKFPVSFRKVFKDMSSRLRLGALLCILLPTLDWSLLFSGPR